MDKEKIDLEVYDKCVDASVALFMQYYCVAASEDIHKEILEMQAEEKVFPETLDTRCRATIKKETAIRKRQRCLKSVVKGLRFVAVFAVVLLAIASTLFMTVEAVRVPIINYYIKTTDKYLELGVSSGVTTEPTVNLDWNNPLGEFLPEEYELTVCNGDPSIQLLAIYENSIGESVYLTIDRINSTVKLDIEGAQTVRKCWIADYEANVIVKNDITTLVWSSEPLGKTFSIIATSLNEMEVIDIAEGIMQGMIS